jgi:HEXXH motif-containing protein
VHEFGHQILYTAMELDPMVEDPTHEGLVLPWSGSERDWYGYFHAFFIYVLLAEYLTRRLQVTVFPEPSIDEERVRLRRDEIMSGIRSALPAINAGALTPAGERVVAALQRRAAGLEANLRRGR